MNRFPPLTKPFPVVMQRSSFGPRQVARAGDVWRAMQDVVVDQSSDVGWTAERYLSAGTMFVVRTMAVQHLREVRLGEPLVGRSWPARARRDMLFTREARIFSGEELVASGTNEWAYLTRDLQPTRAGADLYAAFRIEPGFPSVALPHGEPVADARVHRFGFRTWHTWMDPHAHLNHPAYLDLCDESTSRAVAAAGFDPQALVPVAEQLHYRAAIAADAEVVVETQLHAAWQGAGIFGHRVMIGQKVCANGTTVRRLAQGPGDWWERLRK